MKKEIHPEYFDATVSCICGTTYTGEQRIVDTEGRVERMRRRYGVK